MSRLWYFVAGMVIAPALGAFFNPKKETETLLELSEKLPFKVKTAAASAAVKAGGTEAFHEVK